MTLVDATGVRFARCAERMPQRGGRAARVVVSPTEQTRGGSGNIAESERALAVVLPDQTIVHVNDAYCRLVGRPAADIVGGSVAMSGISDERRAGWVYDRLPPQGRGYRYAREIPTAAGPRRFDVEIHSLALAGENVVLVELTPAEGIASASDAGVLGMVLDRAPGVGVAVYDRELRIVRVNATIEQIGQITPAHIGMPLTEAVPDVNPLVVGAIRQAFATGEVFLNLEVTGADRERSYLMTIFPIGDREDEVEWVGSIYSDVSDRVSAERALAESEQRRREILASLLQSEEDERSRIATELHDDTVQVMTAALLAMDRVAMVARKTENPRLADAIGTARATLEEATDRTRRLMFELRPAILHERGLRPALELLADQTAREADAKARVECRVGRYERGVEELVYRTVQEALANVRKHARPRRISVSVAEDGDRLAGEVRDDGRGFDVEAARARPDAPLHLGLDALTERLRAVGGEASIRSAPGEGTSVAFAVPLRRQLRPSG